MLSEFALCRATWGAYNCPCNSNVL